MIQLSLKRSGSPVIVPLNLPASSGAIAEASSQLDQASGAGKTEIVEIKSVIANLPSYLSGLDPDSRTQLAQLNRLSSIIAQMDSREQNIYAGALDGSSINNLNDVIRVAEQVSDYILIPNVNSDVTLGRYVAVAGQMNGDPRFPEAAWPYLKKKKIGAEYYAEHGGAYADFIRANWLGGRTTDCVGLIKGYSWLNPETLTIDYATNGMPDLGANQMYYSASVSGPIDTMPDTPGLAVWHDGHIGVYIGDGYVIEAMNTKNGVVKTQLEGRGWTHWLEIEYINYD